MLKQLALGVAVSLCASAVWAVEGQQVYDQKCKSCHSIGGVGGAMMKLGGPLDDVGAKHDAEWFKAYFADPKSKIPTAKMPKLKLTDDEWAAITQYMLTLKGSAK